jgi:tripeptidyl-peptidase I
MVLSSQLLACAFSAALSVDALPQSARSEYAVKERHFVPRAWTEVGDVSKTETINLQIGLKQQNEGLVEKHLLEVSDPAHARYGQHLTDEEIAEIVAPTDEAVNLVHEWLTDHGITKFGYSPARDWVSVVTTIEKAEELLQTKYSKYRHHSGKAISRAKEWSLPIHLHEHIDVVQPTTSFFNPKAQIESSRFGAVAPQIDEVKYSTSQFQKPGKHGHGVRVPCEFDKSIC